MPYKIIERCLNSPFDSVKLSIGQGTLTEDRSQKTDVRYRDLIQILSSVCCRLSSDFCFLPSDLCLLNLQTY